MACHDLVRRYQAALGKERLEPGKPDFVVALVQVICRRPVLACEAPHVDVPFTGSSCGHGKREYAALPFCVKGRLAHFRYDRTKSVSSAHSNPRGHNEEGWRKGRYGAYHDFDAWRRYMSVAGFVELSHYYRLAGVPRE